MLVSGGDVKVRKCVGVRCWGEDETFFLLLQQ